MRAVLTLASSVLLGILILSSGNVLPTEAGSLVVTSTADSGGGSLRQAIIDAGNNPGLDVITFDPTVFPEGTPATINVDAPYVIEAPMASQPLTIDGTGAGVIIDGAGVEVGGAIHFRPVGAVTGITLKNFTIQNFEQPAPGDDGHAIEIGYMPSDVSNMSIDGITLKDNEGFGVWLRAEGAMSNIDIRNNTIQGNGGSGVFMGADNMADVLVTNNVIGANGGDGIEINASNSPSPSTVLVSGNDFRNNGEDGILVVGDQSPATMHVTVSRNTTTSNSKLGINLAGGAEDGFGVNANDAGDADEGANDYLNFPVLNGVGPTGITGTACENCTIELFIADSDTSGHGEGGNHFATGTADGDGDFEISGCGQNGGATVTATATDPEGNTSEFAENYVLPATPPCAFKNGDLDCDGDVDDRDALIAVIHDAGANQISREPNCPALGSALVQATSAVTGPDIFGDVNCDGDVGAGDTVTVLQHIAEVALTPEPPAGCVPVGELLPG